MEKDWEGEKVFKHRGPPRSSPDVDLQRCPSYSTHGFGCFSAVPYLGRAK